MSWFSSSSSASQRKPVPDIPGKSYSSRIPPPRAPMDGSYSVQAVPSETLALSNKIFVHPSTFNQDAPAVLVNGKYVFVTAPDPTPEGDPRKIRQGAFGANAVQRQWAQLSLASPVNLSPVVIEDFLESVDIEIGTNKKGFEPQQPFSADDLQTSFLHAYTGLILSPGQVLVMDYHGINLKAVVRNTSIVALMQDTSNSTLSQTGHVMDTTTINFSKDPTSLIKIKGSAKRPAANAVISPNFKFEDMGIGGLDDEFGAIFRRAFASRVFPPGLIEKLGIQHVKGILLYGPPGTGKTLMARQIGTMLNAREPKIVNGPEILNKFVGQSEENIRKLFGDAEREYREKGDESELHIIIFDELDAICKQRGSTGGGTGVGDSVVNQLLSKMDGVDQLNNILIIGMTNRLDMIDEALVRPGRLEVHMEINLPDEKGRLQILNIQTSKMRDNKVMDRDVSLAELSAVTKNFSGAEIGGLVKSATSFAFNRHVKVGTMAGVSDDIDKLQVNRADFMHALDEVHPAFGVSEEELATVVQNGIIHYSSSIGNILNDGQLYVEQVRNSTRTPLVSVLLHGPPGSGKTALAATIAMKSNFPFIKLVSPEDMVGFSEAQKIAHMNTVFNDSYKSPLSIVVIDQIERLFDYVPIGPRFSNNVLQALLVLLGKRPPKGRRLLILATTSNRPILTDMDAIATFDAQIHVPSIAKLRHVDLVLRQVGLFDDEQAHERAMELLHQAQLNESGKLLIGIKRLLAVAEMAKQIGRVTRKVGRCGRGGEAADKRVVRTPPAGVVPTEMREGSVRAPLRSKFISQQLDDGHWVSAYAPSELVRVRGHRPYHNWGDRAPWPTSYTLQAIEMDQMWHSTLKSYREGSNIMRFPVHSAHTHNAQPFRVLDIGCGTGTWCLEMSQTWKHAEFWGMDLAPIQPNPAYLSQDDSLPHRVNWLIANFLDKWPFEDMSFDFVNMRFVALGIPEVQFYHVLDEAFRVLRRDGHLEIYERTYQFAAGQVPIPLSNPEMAQRAQRQKKHSHTDLEQVYEEVETVNLKAPDSNALQVLTAHTINSSPLSIIASAIVLYDGKNIVQSPIIRGSFPARSFTPERKMDMRDARLEPWMKKPHAEHFIKTVTRAIESLSPYERDYRFRMILQSLSTMVSESADWLWDEFTSKVVGSENGKVNTHIHSQPHSPWSSKDKFDTQVKEWSMDLNRRASVDKFLELIFGWEDGNEAEFCPGGRKLVGAKTWSNERKLECESAEDKLGSWQMCGFRIQKS
ncbi:hypothetical protein E3P89_02804 [Wallemia ichthyophaga]|uniref:Vesicular-fusion protein SEC18 n=1 Tax=Wallemia ichthyophaga TaxID=245174 RepID=A0A4T0HXL3_WALIC|nr:hypothetical protein E3P90_02820 [Wallemia ichthyophaga]TIB10594.1 hypothetical protein E3P93_02828 [Wallemia ichthyophaga]TIB21129.1 hypothetical protein E3P89_02804 [Wallemia ichthyophaga]TIB22779.1 hypothetical protein E3P88_02839 [Wallemia ichthyophaga]